MAAPSPAPDAPQVRVARRESGAVWLTIERAARHNALARPVLAAVADAVRAAAADPATRYLVLTGAGDKYFAAGGDLRELDAVRDAAAVAAMLDECEAALGALRHCPVPVIALLNGDAIGGGAELALACDLRLQAAHARIGYIHARLAITSAWGGGPDLFRVVGPARALRMMARAELVDAAQAVAWGLADASYADGPDGATVAGFLRPLDTCVPHVLRAFKAQAIAARGGASWAEQRAVERTHLQHAWLHEAHWAAAGKILRKEPS